MRPYLFARALFRNWRRQNDLPRYLTYIVTFTCNARCIMCDSWKKPSPNDLSLEEIEGIFRQLPKLDMVRLSGGEPFVRKDLIDIAHLVRKHLKPRILHVTTNGFLTNRVVEFCEARRKGPPLILLVSVDGVGAKHNEIRGRETAWDSVLRTVEALAPRQKELNLRLMTNQTIVDPDGVEHYKRLRDLLRPMGVFNNPVMAYDVSATYSTSEETVAAPDSIGQFSTFGGFTQTHLRELLDEADRDVADFPLFERMLKRYYLRGIRNRLLGAVGDPNPPCVALNSHMRLYPNGEVPTCQFNSKTVGNLREKSFRDIWVAANERTARQRQWVRKCPGCWAECEVFPNAVYSGDLIAESIYPQRRKRRVTGESAAGTPELA